MRELLILFFLFAGAFFFTVSTIGLLRFPDVYCRLHANTKIDTLGLGLILLSLIIYEGLSPASVKLGIIIIFCWITNPTSGHLVARASYDTGVKYFRGKGEDYDHS